MPPNSPNIPQVRTFEQDVAESMQTKQASVLHIALAEQEREKEVFIKTKKGRVNILIYFISFLFIFGAFGVIGYVYLINTPPQKITLPPDLAQAQDFLAVDQTTSIEVDLKNRSAGVALLSATSSLDTTLGVMTRVVPYIVETQVSGEKTTRAINSQEFFALLGEGVPDIFKRSLAKDITYVRVTDDGLRGGIIVQTNDYDRTVIGLTAWEKTILKDLEKLFGYTQRIEVKELIETITDQEVIEETEVYNPKTKKMELVVSTTTEPVSTFEERVSYINDQITFGNIIRKNIELRTAQGKSGKEYIVYGFPERNTLVIAGSVDVFLRIVDRLPKVN